MWNVDSVSIVPIALSVHGLIAMNLDQHLERLTVDGWIKGLMQRPPRHGTHSEKVSVFRALATDFFNPVPEVCSQPFFITNFQILYIYYIYI